MKAHLLIALLTSPALFAEAAPAINMEARRQSVVDLTDHVEMREARLSELVADIRALDTRTEKRIDEIVNKLSTLEDSPESTTNVNQLKAEVISGLKKSIGVYREKRRTIFEKLRTGKDAESPALTALKGDLDKFDKRTEKRVAQILKLANSMPQSEEVAKYVSEGPQYLDGWYFENTKISEEWKQNRRQGTATKVEQDEILAALVKSVDSLESRIADINDTLENRKVSNAERAIQEQELDRLTNLLASRKEEISSLGKGPSEVPADGNIFDGYDDEDSGPEDENEVGKHKAWDMKAMFEDERESISRDFWSLMQKYTELVQERDKLLEMKQNLAARKKWLSENDK